jgi:hypothetical protein
MHEVHQKLESGRMRAHFKLPILLFAVLGCPLIVSKSVLAREVAYPKLRFEIINITPQMRDEYRPPANLGTAMVGDVEDALNKQIPSLRFGLIITHVQGHPVSNAQDALDEIARSWLQNTQSVRLNVYVLTQRRFIVIDTPFRLIEMR